MNGNGRRFAAALAPGFALAFLLVFFSVLSTPEGKPVREFFLTFDNFRFIAAQAVVIAVGALGMTVVLLGGGVDLSAGSAIALTGIVAACLLHGGHSPGVAFIAALLTGFGIGAVNGSLVSALNAPPFIVTLAMLGVVRGVAQWLAPAPFVSIPPTWINSLMAPLPESAWTIFAPGVWIALLLAALTAVVIHNTLFGRYLLAIGSSEATATLCGIRVARTRVLIYAVAGLFFGFAGLLEMARLRQGDPGAAVGFEVDLLAAALIGGTSLRGGSGSVPGSLLGALIVAVLRNGSQQAGWPPFTQELLVGLALLLAIGLDQLRHGGKAS